MKNRVTKRHRRLCARYGHVLGRWAGNRQSKVTRLIIYTDLPIRIYECCKRCDYREPFTAEDNR